MRENVSVVLNLALMFTSWSRSRSPYVCECFLYIFQNFPRYEY